MTEAWQEAPIRAQETARRTIVLLILCGANALDNIDISVTNVALPTMQDDLGIPAAQLSWIVNGYTITFAGLLLLSGRLGDVFGHRRTLIVGLLLFGIASAAAASAGSFAILVAMRAVQGVAAALIAPTTLAVLASVFPRGRPINGAIGLWGTLTSIAGSAGMVVGGLLADGPGWRWIFWVNVPVVVVLLISVVKYLPPRPSASRGQRLDILGGLSATVGFAMFTYALVTTTAQGWGTVMPYLTLALSTAMLTAFWLHERFIATEPLLRPSILRATRTRRSNAIQLFCGGAMFTMFFMLTLYEQRVLDWSSATIGLAYVPQGAALLVAARLTARLIVLIGETCSIIVGSVLGVAGMLLLIGVPPSGSYLGNILIPSLLMGMAIPLVLVPSTAGAISEAPVEDHGVASGVATVSRVLGGSIILAIASGAAASRSRIELEQGATKLVAATEGYRVGFAIGAMSFSLVTVMMMTHGIRHIVGTHRKSRRPTQMDGSVTNHEPESLSS